MLEAVETIDAVSVCEEAEGERGTPPISVAVEAATTDVCDPAVTCEGDRGTSTEVDASFDSLEGVEGGEENSV